MATHIAFNYPEHISFLFSDRSLGSLDSMVESSLIGKFTKKIFNYFSNNWVINSDINYYKTKCFKMMT
jgi:tRNA uridine 5-carbamoylmethylation protein Kti12